jgi:predicted DNA-binding transcriptional regulator YafY
VLETSTRLLSLLSLLQQRRHWTGPELSQRLEVGPRTVRRDVERLRRLGYVVDAVPGVAGGYELRAGTTVPPLLLDEGEAVAIAVGLRTAVSNGVAGIEETSVRALSKLETLLPDRVRRRVQALGAATVPYPASGPFVAPEVLLAIATACRDHERLRFGYHAHDGQISRREVEPQGLVHTGRRWYLVAWDCDRGAWRTFRADRIQGLPAPGRRVAPRPAPADDLAAYVARGVSVARDRYTVQVILHARIADVAARVPYATGVLEPLDGERCLLSTGAEWLDGLAVYIAVIGVEFEIVSPPELVDRVHTLGRRFTAAARRSSVAGSGDSSASRSGGQAEDRADERNL